MAEEKDSQKKFSTCFETLPFAEMMQKMMRLQGTGSLCSEMMKQIMENPEICRSGNCTEMIQKMMKEPE
jgi:hypothetical protein